MSHSRSLDTLKTYLQMQMQEHHTARSSGRPAGHTPFITVARQAGAGGLEVADRVAARLNDPGTNPPSVHGSAGRWTVVDKTLLKIVLEEHHLPGHLVKFMQEEKSSEVNNIFEDLFGLHPSSHLLAVRTSRTMLRLASLGHVILVGYGGNVVTRRLPGGLHVRLIGSETQRLQHIVRFDGLGPEQARNAMKEEDEARRHYVKKHFKHDVEDPLTYDVVINTDRFETEETARLVVESLTAHEASRNDGKA
jgi:cytidylate kinase-like protein